MFQFIGGVIKYSALILLVLVLSHVIQIKGISISRHVENAMHFSWDWPKQEVTRVTQQLSSSIATRAQKAEVITDDHEFSAADKKELNRVIQKSAQKK